MKYHHLLFIAGLILLTIIAGGNSNNLAGGYSGSSWDRGNCSACHVQRNNWDCTLELMGLPDILVPGQTYSLQVILSSTILIPGRVTTKPSAGFQLSVLNSAGQNVGEILPSRETELTTSGGRNYLSHAAAKFFPDNVSIWSFGWKAPADGNIACTFSVSGLIGNAAGNSDDDRTLLLALTRRTIPPVNIASVTTQDVSCFGLKNGTAEVLFSGGVGPFSIRWSNGGTTAKIVGLGAGDYEVTIADGAGGSEVSAGTSIHQPDALELELLNTKLPTCANSANGEIEITGLNGTSPYRYLWSNGQTTSVLKAAAGNYQVTVTDQQGCSSTNMFTIDQTEPLKISKDSSNITCYKANDGEIILDVNGNTGTVSYLWSDGNRQRVRTKLKKGIYSVTATDGQGCNDSTNISILEPDSLSYTLRTTVITCHNQKNGMISVIPSGGTRPYRFIWNNNKTTSTINQLGENMYSVLIVDNNGCEKESNVIDLINPDSLKIIFDIKKPSKADIKNGQIQCMVSGGYAPYRFTWNNSQTTSVITNLATGTYEVTVTDQEGCSKTGEVILPAETSTAIFYPGQSGYFELFPNPISSNVNVINKGYFNEDIQLSLYNLAGKLLFFSLVEQRVNQSLDLSFLTPGIYLIKLSTRTTQYQQIIIKI